jgi:hypothetical protein
MKDTTVFHFSTGADLVYLLGIKARNPAELLDGLRTVPASSVYYHTHRFLQEHMYLSPEPPNDFSYWLTSILSLRELGEAVAAVDVIRFNSLEELRGELVRVLEDYLSQGKYTVSSPEGSEFHFMSSKLFILPTRYAAHDFTEFADAVGKISARSLYFHLFESRLRLQAGENDFSEWFESAGEPRLAREIARLDPYTMTLEGLRERIVEEVNHYVRA